MKYGIKRMIKMNDIKKYYGYAYKNKPNQRLIELLNEENTLKNYNFKPFSLKRWKKFKELFLHYGDNTTIVPSFSGSSFKHISIGNNTFINADCTMLGGGDIHIGNNVWIGPKVLISTVNHDKKDHDIIISKNIEIEDNVFIGGNVSIMPGVRIKKGAFIGAGLIITKDVEENEVVIGGIK